MLPRVFNTTKFWWSVWEAWYAIWDVKTRKPKFFDIPNNYGFYTIDIKNGKLPNIDNIPKYPRVRLRTVNTTEAELKTNIKEIKKKSRPKDIIIIKQDKIQGHATNTRSLTRDVRDINYQNTLLQEYMEKNHDIDSDMMKQIKRINKTLNNELRNEDITRNLIWKLKTFEFSNMFSYGPDNKIDFTKAKDLLYL